MLIYGTRSLTTTSASGTFHCPRCAAESPYQHRRVRRFFTLYFIPLIPLNRLGEYVECRRCAATFQIAVLDYDPKKERQSIEAEYHRAVRRVMAVTAGADGVVTPEEVERLQAVYRAITGVELSTDAVQQEIRTARSEGPQVAESLAVFAGRLNDEGKEQVLRAACLIAAADGRIGDEERAHLKSISEALLMSAKHFKAVLDSVST